MLSPNNVYPERRRLLTAQLRPATVAVRVANDPMPTSAHSTLSCHPNSRRVYVTGLAQPQTALVLCPDYSWEVGRSST